MLPSSNSTSFDGNICGKHRLDDFFFVVAFEGEDFQLIKRHDDGAVGGQFGVVPVETVPNIRDGSSQVVGQAINDDQGSAGTKLLSQNTPEIIAPQSTNLILGFGSRF